MIQTEKTFQKNAEDNSEGTKPQSINLISRESVLARLNRGQDARTRFVESHLDKGIAFQLRALRDREGLSQQELAEKVGMTQNAISRLESSTYGKATITTLKRLASVYDVALIVRFVPFSYLVDWVSGIPQVDFGISSSSFDVPAFDNDPGLLAAAGFTRGAVRRSEKKDARMRAPANGISLRSTIIPFELAPRIHNEKLPNTEFGSLSASMCLPNFKDDQRHKVFEKTRLPGQGQIMPTKMSMGAGNVRISTSSMGGTSESPSLLYGRGTELKYT